MVLIRAILGLDLPPGKTEELTQGGYYAKLIDLKAQVREGQSVPITLEFKNKEKKRQTVDVRSMARPDAI
jgi:copper(I)-binding protein